MQGFIFLVVAVLVISAIVGAIAQFLNRLNEAAGPAPRPNGPRPGNPPGAGKDMDRFLAEIDRLRRKAAAEAGGETPPKSAPPARAEPVSRAAQPVAPARDGLREQDRGRGRDQDRDRERRRERDRERERERNQDRSQDRPKARPVTTRSASPPPPPTSRRIEQPAAPLAAPVTPGTLSPGARAEDLPVAPVVTGPAGSTGAPAATRVTKLASRPRPAAKTDFAKNLTALLGSGQGAAAAAVLAEIFGPPKARRPGV